MNIQLFDVENVVVGKRGKKVGGERYSAYRKALEPHIAGLKAVIDAKGKAVVSIDSLATELGYRLRDEETKKGGLSLTAFRWGIEGVLFVHHGIVAEMGHVSVKGKAVAVLVLREKSADDELPPSLAKTMGVDRKGKPLGEVVEISDEELAEIGEVTGEAGEQTE